MKIAVISGKGGSGKSSVTAAFISMSKKVVGIDCDVDASNLPLLFEHKTIKSETFESGQKLTVDTDVCIGCGTCVNACAYQALKIAENGKAAVVPLLCEGCNLCARLCPVRAVSLEDEANSMIYTAETGFGMLIHGDLCPGDDNSGKMIARLREIADKEMEERNIPLQILDGPPGIGCPVLSTATGMDKIVIVTEPTLSGISDLQRAYTVAHSFCEDISVIINKSTVNAENCAAIRGYCAENGIPVIAELPFDRKLVDAQLHCESIVSYAPESECSKALEKAFNILMK